MVDLDLRRRGIIVMRMCDPDPVTRSVCRVLKESELKVTRIFGMEIYGELNICITEYFLSLNSVE
jgi:hypothetical protein